MFVTLATILTARRKIMSFVDVESLACVLQSCVRRLRAANVVGSRRRSMGRVARMRARRRRRLPRVSTLAYDKRDAPFSADLSMLLQQQF